ncbi:UNKNOWN [Stylonychia lemnae]|uniref:Uncharacterized protein n=1 Tax=Stylonychia lemnae TaxID=5949 RepID=A0A078AE23_STYLE|nr:UNKNOWN [Stylonychia lemnae]|eukprot:CDW79163.1 UNKNOWN [Stylonychia lemnae]
MAEAYQQQITQLLKKHTKFKPIYSLAPNHFKTQQQNLQKSQRASTLSPNGKNLKDSSVNQATVNSQLRRSQNAGNSITRQNSIKSSINQQTLNGEDSHRKKRVQSVENLRKTTQNCEQQYLNKQKSKAKFIPKPILPQTFQPILNQKVANQTSSNKKSQSRSRQKIGSPLLKNKNFNKKVTLKDFITIDKTQIASLMGPQTT